MRVIYIFFFFLTKNNRPALQITGVIAFWVTCFCVGPWACRNSTFPREVWVRALIVALLRESTEVGTPLLFLALCKARFTDLILFVVCRSIRKVDMASKGVYNSQEKLPRNHVANIESTKRVFLFWCSQRVSGCHLCDFCCFLPFLLQTTVLSLLWERWLVLMETFKKQQQKPYTGSNAFSVVLLIYVLLLSKTLSEHDYGHRRLAV